jgi:hypothetical protein
MDRRVNGWMERERDGLTIKQQNVIHFINSMSFHQSDIRQQKTLQQQNVNVICLRLFFCVDARVCVCVCMCVCVCVRVHVCVCARARVCNVCVCACMRTCVRACVCVCLSAYYPIKSRYASRPFKRAN